MSNSKVDILQELVHVARDSKSFYEDAAKEIKNPIVRQTFERMASAKGELINKLSSHINARGEVPETGGTFLGGLRQTYADMRAAISSNDDAVYTAQLEETEDRLLKYFDKALEKTDSMEIRAILKEQLPKVRACHDEMKRLKTSLAA